MEGLPARADIDARCRRVARRRREIESSIRRGDRRRIIREWALHRQDGIFGTDRYNDLAKNGWLARIRDRMFELGGRAGRRAEPALALSERVS